MGRGVKKSYRQFEGHIHSIIKKYVPILLLQRHTFEVERGAEDDGGYMSCVFNYPYLNVTIRYSEKAFIEWKKGKDMTPYVVHEMCHPITDPLYAKATSRWASHDEVRDEREQLTDLICNIVLQKK